MILNQEQIRRMTGAGGGGAGGGGSFDPSAAGMASQSWVDENYVSKDYFNQLFKVKMAVRVLVTDPSTTPATVISDTTTVRQDLLYPNEVPEPTTTTDEETGYVTSTTYSIDSIQVMGGLWTNSYLSALGQNSGGGGGGGGGSSTLQGLLDVNIPATLTQANDGQVLMYNYSQNKWINANLPPTGVTSVGMTVPTGFSVSTATITSSGTFAISFANGYSLPLTNDVNKGVTAYGWGNHANAGYALASNVYSKTEADQKFMTIAAFENLFNALDSSNQKVSHPYSSDVASIKAMVGLWTNQYLSALGLNSSGGGGGGGGTVTSVGLTMPTGFNVGSSPVTSSGTITVTFASGYALPTTADVNKGVTAYGWGDHAQAGYATPSSVASQMENYAYISSGTIHIGNNSITPVTSVSGTFWGQSWSNGNTVNGTIDAGSSGGSILSFHSIELNSQGSLSDYGGFIDFHMDGYGSDYTSRLIETDDGIIKFMAKNSGGTDIRAGFVVGEGKTSSYVQIGTIRLVCDSNENLRVVKANGTAASMYATGGVSALGITNPDNNPHYITAQRYYLDASRYLFLDNGTLKYNDNGTVKTVAFS